MPDGAGHAIMKAPGIQLAIDHRLGQADLPACWPVSLVE